MTARTLLPFLVVGLLAVSAGRADEAPTTPGLSFRKLDSKEVGAAVEYSVLLPKGYDPKGKKLALMLLLHGGGGSARQMEKATRLLGDLMDKGDLTPMVVVTPSCARSLYVNRHDGKANWENFLLDELLPTLRKELNVVADRKGLVVMGPSMGGQGTLRLAFKRPDLFLAAAASAPGVEAGLTFKDVPPEKYITARPLSFTEGIFGKPVDADGYWTKNNPAAIAKENAAKIRASGLKLWIEVGTADDMNCYPGTVFLHEVLQKAGIEHVYNEVKDGKHDVAFFGPSLRRGAKFLSEQVVKAAEK
jgi:S-formylglutathione hydrolase FrmB